MRLQNQVFVLDVKSRVNERKRMKYLPLTLLIGLSACGGSHDSPDASPTPIPVVSSTPTPTPSSSSQALVGNWIEGTNTLVFKADGTALSNTQALSWSVDSSENLLFTSNSVSVDSCAFEILTSGGLTTTLKTVLDLACQKAGALTYTRAP